MRFKILMKFFNIILTNKIIMKRIFIYVAFVLILPFIVKAQTTEVPLDENVRIGKLDNGFTYYLRNNGYPENRVQFRLVVDAGSMQEDDDQLGIAHFVEHMAFNGTKHYQKNELVDFLQTAGVEFGADLNAYTSFEETVYILPLSTDQPELLDKGLQVLEDWASGLLFDSEEIDKERGVVIEEWRLGQGAQQRMRDEYFPILFKDSRYANRLPIGTKEIIENAPYDRIRQFYKDWYRPDLMALIAVGDIDVDEMEKEIRSRFSKIKPVENPREKISNEIPDHEETLIAITKDKENTYTVIQVFYKQDLHPFKTLDDMRNMYLRNLYNQMMNQRLQELTQLADPPFIFGNSGYGGFVRAKDNYSSFAVVGENGIKRGLETLIIENERVKRHGFTEGELKRAIENIKNNLENATKELGKTRSSLYASEYIRHFLEDEPSPGVVFEYEFFKKIASGIKLEEINTFAKQWITDKNRVVIIQGMDKEDVRLPTEEEIMNTLNNLNLENIEAYEDNVSEEGLMSEMPKSGKVINEQRNETTDITELTLSNGVRIVVKETDFKNDEIMMNAFSLGGHSNYPDEDYHSASLAAQIVTQSGIKNINFVDLSKMLTGKTVRVSPFISSLREGFNGSAAPKDFEIMMQLIHLYFTQARKDETAFQSLINRNKMSLQNLMASPNYYYQDQVSRIMSQNHLRGGGFPTTKDLDKVHLDRAFEIYQDRFSNAGDFIFFFVGNLRLEEAKPLFETYLGSLPNTGREETWKDVGVRPPKGPVDEKIHKGTDPKSLVNINFVGEKELSKKERYLFSSLGQVLGNRLIEILREDESGVYGASARGSYSSKPYASYRFTISFPCAPENVDRLITSALDEIKKIQKEGVSDTDITKVKEVQTKNREENLKRNQYWIGQLNAYYYNESDLDSFYDYEKLVEDLNSEDLQAIATDLIMLEKGIKIVLYPE